MGLIKKIKEQAQKSGTNKEKILFVKSDSKVRVRFLQEIDDGFQFVMHTDKEWKKNGGTIVLCQEELKKDCPFCNDDEMKSMNKFAWTVWNYDTKRVEIALFSHNQCSPVASFIDMNEEHGTMMDRDYVLKKTGSGTGTTFTVIPQDKCKFRNDKAKPFTHDAMVKILDKAYPYTFDTDSDDDEEEEEPKKKKSGKKSRNDDDEPEKKTKKKGGKEADKYAYSTKSGEIVMPLEWIEEYLSDNDVDEDEFIEYCEISSLKKLKGKTKKEIKKLVNEYIEDTESDDDDDDEEDED